MLKNVIIRRRSNVKWNIAFTFIPIRFTFPVDSGIAQVKP
jgi:hypothetical protein